MSPPRRRRPLEPFEELPLRQRLARERGLEALSLIRRKGFSLARAAGEVATTPRTVRKYAGRALVKEASGRWAPKPWDRITRLMRFPKRDGLVELPVRDSRSASKIARYFAAVDHFLKTGDTGRLRRFRRKFVQVDKVRHVFVTNPTTLRRLGAAGEISFEDLYAQTT